MRKLVQQVLSDSCRLYPLSFLKTLVAGIISKMYALLIFFLSIKVVSEVFEAEDPLVQGGGIETTQLFVAMAGSDLLLALGLVFAFFLVGFFDYCALKARSQMIVIGLSQFKTLVLEKNKEVTPLDLSRATNSFRMMYDSFIGFWVFTLVCLAALLCLLLVSMNFGLILIMSVLAALTCLKLIPKPILQGWIEKIPSYYKAKLFKGLGVDSRESVELVAEKYESIYVQQCMLVITHLCIGLMLAILIICNALGYMHGLSVFDVVVFIYTLRFVANNGRNALLSYIKSKSNLENTLGYIS